MSDRATFTSVGAKIGESEKIDGKDKDAKDRGKDKERDGRDLDEKFVLAKGRNDQPAKKEKAKPRKIRYSADLRVIVEDFEKSRAGLNAAIAAVNGLRETEEINTSPGSPRSGAWRIRVPVDQLETFRESIIKLGEVERNTLSSEDLTAQYYDLEAHLKNLEVEREAIRDLLKEVTKKDLKNYLEVKGELNRVTDDINRKKGQLKLWGDLTDLTTCTVHLREKQKYNADLPPERVEIPTFEARADKTWTQSWEVLIAFFQGLAIAAVAVTPWLPIPVVILGSVWLISRFARRSPKAPLLGEKSPTP